MCHLATLSTGSYYDDFDDDYDDCDNDGYDGDNGAGDDDADNMTPLPFLSISSCLYVVNRLII